MFKRFENVNPVWYFNIPGKHIVFPNPDQLQSEWDKLDKSCKYKSEDSAKLDMAYQALLKGYIETNSDSLDVYKLDIPVEDQYKFLKRYFKPTWAFFSLLLQLLKFSNPFKEIQAYIKSKGIKQVDLSSDTFVYNEFKSRTSGLVSSRKPLVSIIIPTLNRYEYLVDVFKDLSEQTYKNFEVIVIDQSDKYDPQLYEGWPFKIVKVRQDEKALWLARNTGIRMAEGEFIALTEDDVRFQNDWLETHLKVIDLFNSDISNGVFYPAGTKIPQNQNKFMIANQFSTGNAVLKKEVFKTTGLFDRQFEKQRMGDGEFGMRAYLHGFKNVSNPLSSCVDVKAPSGGLRELGSWDAFRPKSIFSPRPIPSVLYYFRKYYGRRAAVIALIISLGPSIIPYQYKRNKSMLMIGVLLSVLLFPIILLQVMKSWKISTRMLKEGDKIEFLPN